MLGPSAGRLVTHSHPRPDEPSHGEAGSPALLPPLGCRTLETCCFTSSLIPSPLSVTARRAYTRCMFACAARRPHRAVGFSVTSCCRCLADRLRSVLTSSHTCWNCVGRPHSYLARCGTISIIALVDRSRSPRVAARHRTRSAQSRSTAEATSAHQFLATVGGIRTCARRPAPGPGHAVHNLRYPMMRAAGV